MDSSRIPQLIRLSSVYTYKCYRDGNLVWEHEEPNLVTNEGLDYAMSLIFGDETETSPVFYVGLIGKGPFPTSEDTMASHNFVENTDYTKKDRGVTEWQRVGVGTYLSGVSQFFMQDSTSVYGAFLTTGLDKGGSEGHLYGASFIEFPKSVQAGDVLYVEIRVKATG